MSNPAQTLYDVHVNLVNADWHHPPNTLTLNEGDIHVWRIALDDPSVKPEDLFEDILSEDEKERAHRLRIAEYRQRFVTSRGFLRKILADYLNTHPRDIAFEYNRYGKPGITAGSNLEDIMFNLTHSRDLALCAVAKKSDVGIDVEFVRRVMRADKILERFFSEGERDFYDSQPETMKNRAFLYLWTIKEAYSKAIGTGFTSRLKGTDLSSVLGDASPACARVTHGESERQWYITVIAPGGEYIGALAFGGDVNEINYFLAGRAE